MRNRKDGFSMIEVVTAAAILITCLLPVVVLSQQGLSESGWTQEELLGGQLLMDMSERYKGFSPEELRGLAANPALLEQDTLLQPMARPSRMSGSSTWASKS